MGNRAAGAPGSARARTATQGRGNRPDLWVLWDLWDLPAPERQEDSPRGRSHRARGCRTPYGTFVC